ncbi:MAG: hypothetical protein JSW18_02055 [Candidatus Omnitrophota bacterium]|nr:MAG: hypothetical protein JSW18_02055 [Candidatus Omnitrophota bacterium]
MCYTVPLAGAMITSLAWRKSKSVKLWWLNLMFYGGALFGVIDHLWNGELFLISENIIKDLLLGVTITLCILLTWAFVLAFAKINPTLANHVTTKR